MNDSIRILIVEDLPTDAELAEREIKQVLRSCVFQRVETGEDYLAALETFQPDLIVSDYQMPRFDGLTALKLALERTPLTPLIILTGAMNEDTAVECMKAGATDYVIKEHLKRLGQAVIRALEEKQARQERQQMEQQLHLTQFCINHASIGIFLTGPDARIRIANDQACQSLGYTREELCTMYIFEIDPTMPHERWLEHRQNLQISGASTFETVHQRKDGTTFPVEITTSYLEFQGEGFGISFVRDISERKQAEEAHAKLEAQLRQAQKMESIGRLAGGVAHDFNNLLTVIRGYCDLMQNEMSLEDPLLEQLDLIRRAGERATALTRQLLAFSRKQILAPTILDLNDLVANLRKMLERLIGEDITLSTILQPGLWPVTADVGQIEQVIMNLVINARDAMLTGGLLIIETHNVYLDDSYGRTQLDARAGPWVMLSVTDTGCGMDEQTQAHLFEPFFTTKEPGKGTGLGLATVYGIIKQSGGDIIVYSEPGQGTIFKIYLPARETTTHNLPVLQVQPVTRGGNETILLVEDEETVRLLVGSVLRNNGYTILQAGHGGEALSLFEQNQGAIDLLVTDVVMPYMSGRDLAARLKARQPQLKVLFTSGYTDDEVVRHGLLAAEVEFLPKPFLPSALVSKVREVLDK